MPPNRANHAGAIEIAVDEESFATKLLGLSRNVEEAIRRTTLTDEHLHNKVVRLYSWLKEFNCIKGLETLKFWLDGRLAIGGYNFALAIQGHAKIPVPSAMGVKLSKEEKQNIKDVQMAREHRRAREDIEDNEGE